MRGILAGCPSMQQESAIPVPVKGLESADEEAFTASERGSSPGDACNQIYCSRLACTGLLCSQL